MTKLNVIMYHYVMSSGEYPYYRYYLSLDTFKQHLDFFQDRGCNVVIPGDVQKYKDNDVVLTFDDGLSCHYKYVYPLLKKYGYGGIFFPCCDPLVKRCVLPVQKVQHVMAKLETLIPENTWVKKHLQYSNNTRLLEEFYQSMFPDGILPFPYYSLDHARKMCSGGMLMGLHGSDHLHNDDEEYVSGWDVKTNLRLLSDHGLLPDYWYYAYPYGEHDDQLVKLLKRSGCSGAFTTEKGKANTLDMYRMARYDANDVTGWLDVR